MDQSADEVLEAVIVGLAADKVTTAEVDTAEVETVLTEVMLVGSETLEVLVAQLLPTRPKIHQPDEAELVLTGVLVATGNLMLLVVTTVLVPQLVPKPKIQNRLSI